MMDIGENGKAIQLIILHIVNTKFTETILVL